MFSALTVKIVVTGGIADAQARREYLQTQGWTLGGPLYRRPQAGWAGDLSLHLRHDLWGGAAKTENPARGTPQKAAPRLHHDGQRAFCQLAGGERSGQAHHPGTVSDID